MRKRMLYLLAILATVVLLAVGLTVGASADTLDNANYASLAEAIAAAKNGDTVDITADISVDASINVTKTITLTSSNGSTVTALTNNILNVGSDSSHSGNLTIEGDLTITSGGNDYTVLRMINGTATIQGNATLTALGTTIRMAGDDNLVGNSSVYIKENAMIRATSSDESRNAIYVNDKDKANLYIQGGTVYRPEGRGIDFPAGKITISGGTLNAKYGIRAWYQANAGVKSITVSGGTVHGDVTGIYVNDNAKNLTLKITGGVVSGDAHAIDYRATNNPSNNSILIEGGTLTAPGQTVFFYRCSAVTMAVKGGTIEATTGGNTIYGAELRGDLTLNISGSSKITAATQDTVVATVPGNLSTYPGKLNATVSGGSITAGTVRAINVQHGKVTVSGGFIYAVDNDAIFTNKTGAEITVTGGTIAAGDRSVFAITAPATEANLQISGGMMILGGTNEEAQIVWTNVDESAACKVTVNGGKFLYGENVKVLWSGTEATKTAAIPYDLNGDGVIGAGETFYVSFSIPATNVRFSGDMEKGAAVRIADGKNGLKFTTVFSANAVKSLNNKSETGSVITYGTLILPTSQLALLESYDVESLVGLIGTEGCFHLVAGKGAQATTGEDGSVTLQAAITGLQDETVSYSAISYVCLTSGHEVSYYFTAYNPADNARSARVVAEAALADTEAGYTAEQTAVLQSYLEVQSLQLPASEGERYVLLDDARKKWLF